MASTVTIASDRYVAYRVLCFLLTPNSLHEPFPPEGRPGPGRRNLGTPCQSREVTRPDGRTMDGMAVVESAENQGAWEQRRVQVALRIELAGLHSSANAGLDDVTVEQIAKEAGISVRTFFRYFRNARDILTAVPVRESRRMCRALLVRPAGESLLDGFHGWFHEMRRSRDLSTPTGVLERGGVRALERHRARCARVSRPRAGR